MEDTDKEPEPELKKAKRVPSRADGAASGGVGEELPWVSTSIDIVALNFCLFFH